jgi:hypothetical protein
VGNEVGGSGTIACALQDTSSEQRVALSCGHVVARFGAAEPGENVWVPSPDEANSLGEAGRAQFGTLVSIGRIGFAQDDAANNIDAATFVPDDRRALSAIIALVGVKPKTIRDNVPLQLPVQKVGFTTGLTSGRVEAVHLVVSLEYPGDQEVWFADQIGISSLPGEGPFTDAGDSGALVMDRSAGAVGLHIGSFDGMSICTPIRRVLDALGCKLA